MLQGDSFSRFSKEFGRILRESWKEALDLKDESEISMELYDRCFADFPQVKPYFDKVKFAKLALMFLRMIKTSINFMDNLKELVPQLHACGVRHVKYGMTDPSLFQCMGVSLIRTLGDTLGDKWTNERHDAWTTMFQMICKVLSDGLQCGLQEKAQSDRKKGGCMIQ